MKRTMFLIFAIMLIGFAGLTFARLGSHSSLAQDSPNHAAPVATSNQSAGPVVSNVPQMQSAKSTFAPPISNPYPFVPFVPQIAPNSNGLQPPTTQGFSNVSSFNSGTTPTVAKRSPQFSFSPNALEVENLVRAQYLLPREAAENLEKLFAFDEAGEVETRISKSAIDSMVMLQITTDAKTQQATAAFLNAIYPTDRVQAMIDSEEETAEQSSARATNSSTQTVSLKLPGMT